LVDVYAETDGTVHVLYAVEGQANLQHVTMGDGFPSNVDSQIPAAYQVVMSEWDGQAYVIAVDSEQAAAAIVYVEDGDAFAESFTMELDQLVRPYGQLMVARATNGSICSDNFLMMLSGKVGLNVSWYYAVIPATTSDEE